MATRPLDEFRAAVFDYLREAGVHARAANRPEAPAGVQKGRAVLAIVFAALDAARSLRQIADGVQALATVAHETAIAQGVREP